MKCNCKSYNWEVGSVPERILETPKDWGIERKTVCIDECIADVVQHLWNNGVVTEGSCCGHNRQLPSIILSENTQDYNNIHTLITEVTNRKIKLLQWQLLPVKKKGNL